VSDFATRIRWLALIKAEQPPPLSMLATASCGRPSGALARRRGGVRGIAPVRAPVFRRQLRPRPGALVRRGALAAECGLGQRYVGGTGGSDATEQVSVAVAVAAGFSAVKCERHRRHRSRNAVAGGHP
jgi:hypothetical protein